MKTAGIILIILGILMVIVPSVTMTQKKQIAKIGSIEINKKEKKTIGWPSYLGAALALGGTVMVVASKKKS